MMGFKGVKGFFEIKVFKGYWGFLNDFGGF